MKFLKIIFTNAIILLTFFILTECCCYFAFKKQVEKNFEETNRKDINNVVKYNRAFILNYENYSFFFKKYANIPPPPVNNLSFV